MKYALVNGIILDGTLEMEPQSGKVILLNGENIEKIVDMDTDISEYEIIDLNNQYIMPGLINMHVHLPASGKPSKKESDPKKTVALVTSNNLMRKIVKLVCYKNAMIQLNSGVTTFRTVGGIENFDTMIRDEINSGKKAGPRILASNMAVSVPGGHMAGSLAYEVKSEDQAREYVRVIAKDKPDLIKLMITGGVLDAKVKGEPGTLKMAPELVKAACEEAHGLGLIVAAHVESPEGVRVALENGVDTIEHGAKPDAHIIDLFRNKKAALIATLTPTLPFALFDKKISHANELTQYNGNVVFRGIIDAAKECLAKDIPVGLGTDTGCPFITHYDMWREVYNFHKYCDVTNAFALYTATKVNAQIAGIADRVGTVEEGKCADLIVTKDNPLKNLKALRNVKLVISKGNIIREPKVKKNRYIDEQLDLFL